MFRSRSSWCVTVLLLSCCCARWRAEPLGSSPPPRLQTCPPTAAWRFMPQIARESIFDLFGSSLTLPTPRAHLVVESAAWLLLPPSHSSVRDSVVTRLTTPPCGIIYGRIPAYTSPIRKGCAECSARKTTSSSPGSDRYRHGPSDARVLGARAVGERTPGARLVTRFESSCSVNSLWDLVIPRGGSG